MSTAMLSFKIGPVQPFIEAARTLRDLWSGSYLLSWLTAHAMTPLFENGKLKPGVTFITPDLEIAPDVGQTNNPLLRAALRLPKRGSGDPTLACLPHTFAVAIDDGVDADDLRNKCVSECRAEWTRIADAVRVVLREQAEGRMKTFLDLPTWDRQIETHFEITCVVRETLGTAPDSKAWAVNEWDKLAELLEMTRSVRHVPAYSPTPDEKGRFPVKCSQLGSLEQIGPADFDKAKAYWAGLTRKGNDETPKKKWDGLHGTGLQSSDKLCAVALVKRFMWPFYFAKSAKHPRLDMDVRELRLTDTATMAAKKWLGEGEIEIDPKVEWKESECGHWSGQWLHWTTRDQDDDAVCPEPIWNRIDAKRRAQGKPPTYFALMHLDGDNMGDMFKGSRGRIVETTTKLTKFAAGVKQIVEDQGKGELIYAGGDDVLAFLPTETVIECARQLREAFGAALGKDATLSGGIAVVHYKEDLRFALGQVRAAEKAAKRISRATLPPGQLPKKDALALTICKRSGEHSTVVMGWPEAEKLQPLIAAFVAKASDRWAYKLRAELETLKGLPLEAGKAEALRLVGRGEFGSKEKKVAFEKVIGDLFEAYQKQMQHEARNWTDSEILTGFVALCQSASFLARGKE